MFTPSRLLTGAPNGMPNLPEGHHVTLNYADPNLTIDYNSMDDRTLKMHLEDAVLQYEHVFGWLRQFEHAESIRLSKINLELIEAHFHRINAARQGEIFFICNRVPALIKEVQRFLNQ